MSFLSDRNLKRCVIPSFTLKCDRTIVKQNFGFRQEKLNECLETIEREKLHFGVGVFVGVLEH